MGDNGQKGQTRLNRRIGRYLVLAGLGLALLAAAAELVSGPGTRLGLWHYRTGITLLGIAGIAGGVAAAISLIAGILAGSHGPSYRMAVVGIIIGLVAAGIPWSWSRIGKQVPRIHDITTDTNDPPHFSAVLPLRANAQNPATYGGRVVAEQQNLSYPGIQPLMLAEPTDAVFERALAAAQTMGWEIAAVDRKQGRIEATATTFWFGFKDDVVVRIAPNKEGSRVDVRSASRVGVSDVGTNAKRVRAFLQKMKEESRG